MKAFILTIFCALVSFSGFATNKVVSVKTEDQAVDKAVDVTTKYRLTSDKTECLLFDTFDMKTYWDVRVRENHTPACGGAPEFSPTLYFLRIRKEDGHVTTNAYDPGADTYEELKNQGGK